MANQPGTTWAPTKFSPPSVPAGWVRFTAQGMPSSGRVALSGSGGVQRRAELFEELKRRVPAGTR